MYLNKLQPNNINVNFNCGSKVQCFKPSLWIPDSCSTHGEVRNACKPETGKEEFTWET